MVSRNFLDYLNSQSPPQAVQAFSPDVLFNEHFEDLKASLPDWDATSDSLLYRALTRISFRHYLILERVNNAVRRSFIYYQEGSDLDHGVALAGITRNVGETDDELKERLPRSFFARAVGTIPGIIATAFTFDPFVVDVTAEAQADFQTVKVWALKRENPDDAPSNLTGAERTRLATFLNLPAHKYIGATIEVEGATLTGRTVNLTITHYPDADAQVLDTTIRERLSTYVDSLKLGIPLEDSALIGAANSVPGVAGVTKVNPTAASPARYSVKYVVDKSAIVLTFNALARTT